MFKRFAVAAILIMTLVLPVKAEEWTIDINHSYVGFTVTHMVITKVKGHFKNFDATLNFDGKNVDKGSVSMTVQMNSITTDNTNRDNHLKSPDFFDVEKYPTMTFTSKKITKGEDNKFTMVGDLTIKDVTKEVTFDCELNGVIQDPRGNTRAGFAAETTINRQDFHVSWDNKLKDGGLIVSDMVNITIEAEFIESK